MFMPVMTWDTSMLARMKLVLVQRLGVNLIVISVKPLPPKLNMAIVRKMVTLTITEFTSDASPARLSVSVAVDVALTSNDADTASFVIVPPFYDRMQQHPVWANDLKI